MGYNLDSSPPFQRFTIPEWRTPGMGGGGRYDNLSLLNFLLSQLYCLASLDVTTELNWLAKVRMFTHKTVWRLATSTALLHFCAWQGTTGKN